MSECRGSCGSLAPGDADTLRMLCREERTKKLGEFCIFSSIGLAARLVSARASSASFQVDWRYLIVTNLFR
jgi:hypothetical protein